MCETRKTSLPSIVILYQKGNACRWKNTWYEDILAEMHILKRLKKTYGSPWFAATLIVIGLVYGFALRKVLFNLSTTLYDWFDYPLIVWILETNITHLKSFEFSQFFNGNMFYPNQGVLLFADLLLPTSLMALPISLLTTNKILTFNLVFFLTLILNIFAVWHFWTKVFEEKKLVFLATFLLLVSGFFFEGMVGHFQFMSSWLFFYALAMLIENKLTILNAVVFGLLMGFQFLNGVYLSLFLIWMAILWYGTQVLFSSFSLLSSKKNKDREKSVFKIRSLVIHAAISFITFLVVSGFFLQGYLHVKNQYSIERSYGEYVQYSASFTDYFFSRDYRSLLSKIRPIQLWNNYQGDATTSLYPGIVLIVGGIVGLFSVAKIKDRWFLSLEIYSPSDVFFLVITIWGFVASLGPRLKVAGQFVNIPLPYHLFLQSVPLLDPIRVNTRWALLVFIGLVYFSIRTVQKHAWARSKIVFFLSIILVLIEIVPLEIPRTDTSFSYFGVDEEKLIDLCQQRPQMVLVEYPLNQEQEEANIFTNLRYRSSIVLNSLEHTCSLVNGYSGHVPEDYIAFETGMHAAIANQDSEMLLFLLKSKKVDLVKVNTDSLTQENTETLQQIFNSDDELEEVYQDQEAVIYRLLK